MTFPLSANRIEKLDMDPVKKIDGYIWYNTVEKCYKTYVDEELQVFITDVQFEADIDALVQRSLIQHEFTVSFTDAYKVIIKHNKGQTHFNYNLYDTEENCNLSCSLEIINENEVSVDFVDPVTGYIFMYFE
jgi:hypothetical protein